MNLYYVLMDCCGLHISRRRRDKSGRGLTDELFEFVTFSSRGFATLLLCSCASPFWYSGAHSHARLGQLMPHALLPSIRHGKSQFCPCCNHEAGENLTPTHSSLPREFSLHGAATPTPLSPLCSLLREHSSLRWWLRWEGRNGWSSRSTVRSKWLPPSADCLFQSLPSVQTTVAAWSTPPAKSTPPARNSPARPHQVPLSVVKEHSPSSRPLLSSITARHLVQYR